MMKDNKWKFILTSVVILLPILYGLIYWNELPEQMARHWAADGSPNGYSSKAFVVFGLPLILLALHLLCVYITYKDPKNKNQSKKVFGVIWWICPVICVFSEAYVYAFALGREFDITLMCSILLGLILVAFGNYFPKIKQNSTIGIRTKWTVASEKNWNATHRLGGKVWVAAGILMLASVFLPTAMIPWTIGLLLIVTIALPIGYSYHFEKSQGESKK